MRVAAVINHGTYSVATVKSGPEALAVLGLVTPVESMAIAVMIGTSSTANVIVGEQLERGNLRGAVVEPTGFVLWPGGAVTDDMSDVLACVLVIRAINITLAVGILRAGADTISPIVMDVSAQWLVAIHKTAVAVL